MAVAGAVTAAGQLTGIGIQDVTGVAARFDRTKLIEAPQKRQ